jgi:dTDP-4-amino-4,6-dideoxygalactose transaminase
MADMEALMEISRRYGLRVVEDGAQALGAKQKISSPGRGQKKPQEWTAGTVGDLGCFSFFPTKNLGGFGDGGMVVTRDEAIAQKVRLLRVHGAQARYYHQVIGINSRLDSIQAAVLRVKLKYLNRWTEGRRRNADRYRALFKEYDLGRPFISLPQAQNGFYHIYNQFVIRAKSRDALREHLKERGIGSEIYYPVPLHLQACYRTLRYRSDDLPESERAAREVLALPIYPELTPGQQRQVVRAVADFYSARRTRKSRRGNS